MDKMPENCHYCTILMSSCGKLKTAENTKYYAKERPPKCPLIELPGREESIREREGNDGK